MQSILPVAGTPGEDRSGGAGPTKNTETWCTDRRTGPRCTGDELRRFCAFWRAAAANDAATYAALPAGPGPLDDAAVNALQAYPARAAGEALDHLAERVGAEALGRPLVEILGSWLSISRSTELPGAAASARAALGAVQLSPAWHRTIERALRHDEMLAMHFPGRLPDTARAVPGIALRLPDTSGTGAPAAPYRAERQSELIVDCTVGPPYEWAQQTMIRLEVTELLLGSLTGSAVDLDDQAYGFGCSPASSARLEPGARMIAFLRRVDGLTWQVLALRRGPPTPALRRSCAVAGAARAGDVGGLRALLSDGVDRPAREALSLPTAAGIQALAAVDAARARALATRWSSALETATAGRSGPLQPTAQIDALRVDPGGRRALAALVTRPVEARLRRRLEDALRPATPLFVGRAPVVPPGARATPAWHHARQADVIALGTMAQGSGPGQRTIRVDEVLQGRLDPRQIRAADDRLVLGCLLPPTTPRVSERYAPGARVICMLGREGAGWRLQRVELQRADRVASLRRYGRFWHAARLGTTAAYTRLLGAGLDAVAHHGLVHNPSPAAGRALGSAPRRAAAAVLDAWSRRLTSQTATRHAPQPGVEVLIGALQRGPEGAVTLRKLARTHPSDEVRRRIRAALHFK